MILFLRRFPIMNAAKWMFVSLILILLVSITTNLAFSAPVKTPTIYALLIAADIDPTIGRAVDVDRQRVEGMLKVASGICNVQTEEILGSQGNFKSEPILQWLKNLNPDANDTVFIYYSGHGGLNKNKTDTFFYLQDGYFLRSKLVSAIESVKKCRLKILISDCCLNGPEPEFGAARPPISKKALQDLFLGHEGFLHLSAASEGEYSWCSPRYGGWFTRALIDSFDDSSDLDMDGFVSWDEVFKLTFEAVQKKYQQSLVYFSDEQKKDMNRRGIKSQTPRWYSMAKQASTSSIQQVPQPEPVPVPTIKPETPQPPVTLWSISNSDSSFSVSIEPDKPGYDVGNSMVFNIQATADCYIIILNWNSRGEPIQLYPNKHEYSNIAVKDKIYTIPSNDSKFNYYVSGSTGEEKIKIIALRNRTDSLKLRSLIPLEDSSGGSSTHISVVPRRTTTGENIEAKILSAIKEIDSTNWTTANCIMQIR